MKKLPGVFLFAIALVILTPAFAQAQDSEFNRKEVQPLPSNCIGPSWDATRFLWYQNVCQEGVWVSFVATSSQWKGISGGFHLSPGEKKLTGWGYSEVQKMGGFMLFVCPEHYIPVSADGHYTPLGPETRFICQRSVF